MAKKPTYEELEQRVKELEREAIKRRHVEEAPRESEERFREMADLLPTIISELDMDYYLTYVNNAAFETFGYSQEDLEAGLNVVNMIHPDDRKKAIKNMKKAIKGKKLDGNEYRMFREDGSELTFLIHSRPIYKNGRVVGIRSTLTDITKIKRTEKALREREAELEIKTNSLEEVNTALRVLLKRRDEDKRELEENVLTNVRELVVPFVGKLKESPLDPKQLSYIHILESNLNDIVSPFSRNLSAKYVKLTPKEIRVANLIKVGKTTKEIGEVMTLSPRTIETHRKNMRKKFGLDKKKGNLRSHLLTF
jgi:PAS domain S-box-containing protein